ncbi:MAG: aminotransferase class I/II-fold pyridoxal phosphate-dependent enzyme [Candidatus Marinimicrobia bacterium]|jgi:pyridoxal phosphate-dependent aminotransferase EpsN|nr:aminotransferase class I/II-fold pyridoxal phosphate-dependent enzyme [Candidatus Neomarinimicrobiota bacterium]
MKNNRIYLSPPHMGGKERALLLDAFDSNWIAPLGPHVNEFEKEMAQYLGVKHAAALCSGSSALHLALIIAGIKEGDRVLCPSLTFSASANVILYEKAQPIFVDSDPNTWVLDLAACEKAMQKYNPKALISVDLYGQSCNYNAITDLCGKYNVLLIEDAAEALGADFKSKKCGSFGEMGILSFNGNKIITTSGGGMLVSNNEEFVTKARFLATQAREPDLHYEHKELGYNYRLSNLLAAVGRGQLEVIDDRVSKRRSIFNQYKKALSHVDGFTFMQEADYGKSNRWLTTLTVNEKVVGISRTQIIDALEKENIEARPVWKPMHMQPLYKKCEYIKSDVQDVSAELFENGLCLPSGSSLSEGDQGRIIDIILSLMK